MYYYAVMNGDTLEFQRKEPETGEYVKYFENNVDVDFPPWGKFRNQVKSVRFLDKISPINTSMWFSDFEKLEYFDAENLDLSRTISMREMFYMCVSLQTLDLSGLNVSQVRNMERMFFNCFQLKEINLSGWDTSQVVTLRCMFASCRNLRSIDISEFSLQSVRDISCLFFNCKALKSAKMPRGVSPENVNVRKLFCGCEVLKSADLSFVQQTEGRYLYDILEGCYSLLEIHTGKANLQSIWKVGNISW